jgi:ParB family chromosome partitioning protein
MSSKESNPRLGRGLAALMGEAALPADGASGIRDLSIDLLDAGPFQPRAQANPTSLNELTESIRARGVLQPLLARPSPTNPGRYQIVAGERRWRAAQKAGLSVIPTLIRDLSDVDSMAAGLVENLQRQDLNAIEEAEGYRRLIDEFGLTQEALGTAVGKSRSHIANTLRLLNLPVTVQAEVRNGALSAGHARALLTVKEPEKAALAVIARGLNVRQTEALGAERSQPTAPPPKDPETNALEHDLAERLGLRVDVGYVGPGGTLRIYYRSLDQLDGIIRLLMPQ